MHGFGAERRGRLRRLGSEDLQLDLRYLLQHDNLPSLIPQRSHS